MLNPCKEREPRVINNALIEKCIDLQYPKGEVGRLLRLEGIPMEEVEEIHFEYLYILKIDHLWVLKSLVKLSLNNNFIEKIENLETLVHLRIEEEEREEGIKKFKDPLSKLEREEQEEKEKQDAIEKEIIDAELHSKMFVEYLNTGKLFDTMYEHDEEGIALLEIGEEVTELYDEYKVQFTEFCKQIFEIGEKHHALRQAEIDNFIKSVEKAKKDNQDESIGHMEAFLELKTEIFTSIKEYRLQLEHDAITDEAYVEKIEEYRKIFDELIHTTWKNLMKLELRLFEQVEEVNQTYGQVLEDMINTCIEEVQGVFTNIRAAEVTYSENLNDAGVRYMTALAVNQDEEVHESLKDILYDRDTLNNAMAATHDCHMQIIDAREDTLIHRARGWLESLAEDITKDEIKRNRYKLLEINHFLDIQREEYDDLTTEQNVKVDVEDYEL